MRLVYFLRLSPQSYILDRVCYRYLDSEAVFQLFYPCQTPDDIWWNILKLPSLCVNGYAHELFLHSYFIIDIEQCQNSAREQKGFDKVFLTFILPPHVV
jgi:hypothetical protein